MGQEKGERGGGALHAMPRVPKNIHLSSRLLSDPFLESRRGAIVHDNKKVRKSTFLRVKLLLVIPKKGCCLHETYSELIKNFPFRGVLCTLS